MGGYNYSEREKIPSFKLIGEQDVVEVDIDAIDAQLLRFHGKFFHYKLKLFHDQDE